MKLTLKERAFVDAYCGSCAGNGVQAARAAGYKQSPKAIRVQASRLLAKPNIRAEIDRRANRDTQASILTADERDGILSAIARKVDGKESARIRAIAELNKCGGRHSIKHVIDGKLTLEQVLTESRK